MPARCTKQCAGRSGETSSVVPRNVMTRVVMMIATAAVPVTAGLVCCWTTEAVAGRHHLLGRLARRGAKRTSEVGRTTWRYIPTTAEVNPHDCGGISPRLWFIRSVWHLAGFDWRDVWWRFYPPNKNRAQRGSNTQEQSRTAVVYVSGVKLGAE